MRGPHHMENRKPLLFNCNIYLTLSKISASIESEDCNSEILVGTLIIKKKELGSPCNINYNGPFCSLGLLRIFSLFVLFRHFHNFYLSLC